MCTLFGMTLSILMVARGDVDCRFVQVHPCPADETVLARSQGNDRAIVLIHGLKVHPFSGENARRAKFHDWQRSDSTLVSTLAPHSDVYAFAYGQDVAVHRIIERTTLLDDMRRVRSFDYAEIVLIGHSAGGLIARQLVEEHADIGVTKVIQVCSPNGGSSLSKATIAVDRVQEPFVISLTKAARQQFQSERNDRRIPNHVEFVSVVGDGGGIGDFVVSIESQWPRDLQAQGIPARLLHTTHLTAMRSSRVAEQLDHLVRTALPRWSDDRIADARRELFGDEPTESK